MKNTWKLLIYNYYFHISQHWYTPNENSKLLSIFSYIYGKVCLLRKYLYIKGICKIQRFPVPIWVIGNLTAGGTGKTSLSLLLYQHLKKKGLQPAIILQYHNASLAGKVLRVSTEMSVKQVGEVALLLAQTADIVVVGKDRCEAAKMAIDAGAQIIISDNGLQDYALDRECEIILLDGQKGIGNGNCLPDGPLREPMGGCKICREQIYIAKNEIATVIPIDYQTKHIMQYTPRYFQNIKTHTIAPLQYFAQVKVYAVTTIANPSTFFDTINRLNSRTITLSYPEHYFFKETDFKNKLNYPVLVTHKDAMKIKEVQDIDLSNFWYLVVGVSTDKAFISSIDTKLKAIL